MAFKIKRILAKAFFGAGYAFLIISILYGRFQPDDKTAVIVMGDVFNGEITENRIG